jgi:hypothetical protein
MAFSALAHHLRPSLIDITGMKKENKVQNLEKAFTAFEKMGVTRVRS